MLLNWRFRDLRVYFKQFNFFRSLLGIYVTELICIIFFFQWHYLCQSTEMIDFYVSNKFFNFYLCQRFSKSCNLILKILDFL